MFSAMLSQNESKATIDAQRHPMRPPCRTRFVQLPRGFTVLSSMAHRTFYVYYVRIGFGQRLFEPPYIDHARSISLRFPLFSYIYENQSRGPHRNQRSVSYGESMEKAIDFCFRTGGTAGSVVTTQIAIVRSMPPSGICSAYLPNATVSCARGFQPRVRDSINRPSLGDLKRKKNQKRKINKNWWCNGIPIVPSPLAQRLPLHHHLINS